jgi:protein O-GlcNAc transferase
MSKSGKTTGKAKNPNTFPSEVIPQTLSDLGKKYFEEGKVNEAITSFKKALKADPDFYIAWFNLGLVLQKQNRYQEAIECYLKNIKLYGENPYAFKNLAFCYSMTGQTEEAIQYVKALNLSGSEWETHFNLGTTYQTVGEIEKGIAHFEKARQLNPTFGLIFGQLHNLYMRICEWDKASKLVHQIEEFNRSAFIKGGVPAEMPFGNIAREENPRDNFLVAKLRSEAIARQIDKNFIPYVYLKKKKGEKIRIGYVSCDFHDHATVHLILGLLKLHNRKNFKIYAYSHGVEDKSDYRNKVMSAVDVFRDVSGLNDIEAANLIHKDLIDVLVDLKGHTNGNRLGIFIYRPAPIQVTWLGFPGTTGADFMDYLIADKTVINSDAGNQSDCYSEKLIYLPDTYQVDDNTQVISKKKFKRSDFGLPEKGFIFSSFNQSYKITKTTFTSWMRILKTVPDSVLWLYQKVPEATINLKKEAKKAGINPRRLIFATHAPKEEHLARLKLAGLALDTFTYNGHTTTSDCLWAGVPVITLQGKHFASRVSASLLTAIDLPELITKNQKEYEKIAISLAKNPQKLELITKKLLVNRMEKSLFNTQMFVTKIEKAYRQIWVRYLSGRKPKKIMID